MSNVTKLELITEITHETNIPTVDVRQIVECFLKSIEDHLVKNERLEIRGFGSVYMKKRKKKLVRNPKSPQETKILPERWSPVLRYSKELKSVINRGNIPQVEKKGEFFFVTVFRDFVDSEIEQVSQTVEDLVLKDSKYVVVDFDKVRYIYSPGLSCLVKFNQKLKEMGGQFYLINIKPSVLSKLESVNLDKTISLFKTKEDFENEHNLA